MKKHEADLLVRQAKGDPTGALRVIEAALADAGPTHESEIAGRLNWAKGRALYELARNEEAVDALREGVAISAPDIRPRIQVSLAAALLASGESADAATLLEAVTQASDDEAVVQLAATQIALLELGAGDVRSARDRLGVAVEVLQAKPDDIDAAARGLGNLAYCEMLLGHLDTARRDYERTIELAETVDEGLLIAGCLQNLGYLDVLNGRFPDAIKRLHQAEEHYDRLGAPARNLSSLFDDLAEAYALAGLTPEAVTYANRALEAVAAGGNEEKIAEARLRLAECLREMGDVAEARRFAHQARLTFDTSDRPAWSRRALLVELETCDPSDAIEGSTVVEAGEACRGLTADGWRLDAQRLKNRTVQLLLDGDDIASAAAFHEANAVPGGDESALSSVERALDAVLGAVARREDPTNALGDAQILLATHQLRLSDPELRAGVGRLREYFRRAAVGHAFRAGSPIDMLMAEEAWRGLSSRLPRVVPFRDGGLADLSDAVRQAGAASAADPTDHHLAAKLRDLESKLREASMTMSAAPQVSTPGLSGLDRAHLVERLDGRTFVEWIRLDSVLHGVALWKGDTCSWQCHDWPSIQVDAARAERDLQRLLRPGLDEERVATRWDRLRRDCSILASRLIPPHVPTDNGVVISPVGGTAGLPYSLLWPSSPTAVTGSACAWLSGSPATITGAASAVLGPGLRFGAIDIAAVASVFPDADLASDHPNTGDELRARISSSSILHIAAHGTFRADNPLFSSLELADGRFTLYELHQTVMPRLVTFSACSSGTAQNYVGGDTLGIAAGWLDAGAHVAIAPSCPVPDREAAEVTTQLYRHLRGHTPAEALHLAQQALASGAARTQATAAAYQCEGIEVGHVRNT